MLVSLLSGGAGQGVAQRDGAVGRRGQDDDGQWRLLRHAWNRGEDSGVRSKCLRKSGEDPCSQACARRSGASPAIGNYVRC